MTTVIIKRLTDDLNNCIPDKSTLLFHISYQGIVELSSAAIYEGFEYDNGIFTIYAGNTYMELSDFDNLEYDEAEECYILTKDELTVEASVM